MRVRTQCSRRARAHTHVHILSPSNGCCNAPPIRTRTGEDTTTSQGLEATLSPAVAAVQQQEEVPPTPTTDAMEESIEQAEGQEQPSELLQREPVQLQEEVGTEQQQQAGLQEEEQAGAVEAVPGEGAVEEEDEDPAGTTPVPPSPAPTPVPPPTPPPAPVPSFKDPAANPVLLIVTVDIGAGQSDVIELRKGGDPGAAARSFCEKHGLPPHIVTPLTQHILDNLSKAKQVWAALLFVCCCACGLVVARADGRARV